MSLKFSEANGWFRNNYPTPIPREDDGTEVVIAEKNAHTCQQWTPETIAKINEGVRNGLWTAEEGMRLAAKSGVVEKQNIERAVDAPTPFTPTRQQPRLDRKMLHTTGEGVGGIMWNQFHKKKKLDRDPKQDMGLGFTHMGVAIIPRRRVICRSGHTVTGDNVYVIPSTGLQQCRMCITYKRKGRPEGNRGRNYWRK